VYVKNMTFIRDTEMRGSFSFKECLNKTYYIEVFAVLKNCILIAKEASHIPTTDSDTTTNSLIRWGFVKA
jgi:hypothetical protein